MPSRMGFIGLEATGRAIAASLCAKSRGPLVVFNPITSVAERFAFEHDNCRATSTLTQVVRNTDVIWTCFPNDQEVSAVYEVLLRSDVKGKVFVDCLDDGVSERQGLKAQLATKGATFVDVRVFGDPVAAKAGKSALRLSGTSAAEECLRPHVGDVMARTLEI